MEIYAIIMGYMRYYNKRRRHSSIKCMTLNKFHRVFMSNTINIIEVFSIQFSKVEGQAAYYLHFAMMVKKTGSLSLTAIAHR